jgi:hypothetical protein
LCVCVYVSVCVCVAERYIRWIETRYGDMCVWCVRYIRRVEMGCVFVCVCCGAERYIRRIETRCVYVYVVLKIHKTNRDNACVVCVHVYVLLRDT